MEEAIAAAKCHSCGCLQKTVEALAETPAAGEREPVLARARAVFVPKQYDCLGCPVCYPAIAANAFAEEFPDVGEGLDLCPTEEPEHRVGWPPLHGEYSDIKTTMRYMHLSPAGREMAVQALDQRDDAIQKQRSRAGRGASLETGAVAGPISAKALKWRWKNGGVYGTRILWTPLT